MVCPAVFCCLTMQPYRTTTGQKPWFEIKGKKVQFPFQFCLQTPKCSSPPVCFHSEVLSTSCGAFWHLTQLGSQMLGSLQRGMHVLTWPLLFAMYYHSSPSCIRLLSILMLFSEKVVKLFTNTVQKNQYLHHLHSRASGCVVFSSRLG